VTSQGDDPIAFPTRHQLWAALRAGEVVLAHAGQPYEALNSAFTRTPTEAVFSPLDLQVGAQLLEEAAFVVLALGIVSPDPSLRLLLKMPPEEACELLADRLLVARHPLWVSAATSDGGIVPDLIPNDAARGLEELFPDPAKREAFLITLGRRFTADDRKQVGDLAEEFVVAAARRELVESGRDDLAAKVCRVSLLSDQLGYDVTAPCERAEPRRMEVKGTRAQESTVAIYLSRTEAQTALRDPDWYLVLCRVARDNTVSLVSWTTAARLRDRLPRDPETGGAWQSTAIYLEPAELTRGLPPWRRSPQDE